MPEIIANLTIGLGFFLRFAVEVNAIPRVEAERLLGEAWAVFGRAATAQRRYQSEGEQTALYREMIGAALAGGLAHIALEEGNLPLIETEEAILAEPSAWGWRKDPTGEWRPHGQRVGWLGKDGSSLYLEPDVSLAVARKMATDTGESLSISKRELHNRLAARALILTEKKRDTKVVRKTLEGKRRGVLHTQVENFFTGSAWGESADQTDQSQVSVGKTKQNVVSQVVAMFLQTDRSSGTELTALGCAAAVENEEVTESDWSVTEKPNGQFLNGNGNHPDHDNLTNQSNKAVVVSLVSENTHTSPAYKKINAQVRFPIRAIWRSQSGDQPVVVNGSVVVVINNKRYFSIVGSSTTVPEDELFILDEEIEQIPSEEKRRRIEL